ncbi:MAG: integrase [Deltaproteobacteria bacterium HGW-Deltaproteobacteria-21]|nr:MAG: integrase [Deltaproteobacteria bacterium HGW-Deltaproteobacteria-21]
MPTLKRNKTEYPEVFFVWGTSPKGKPEKIFYIRYYKNGKRIEEKAGRQGQDDMTAARANGIRVKRIEGELSNEERRELTRKEKAEKEAVSWTFNLLWEKYLEDKPELKGRRPDACRFTKYIKPHLGDREPQSLLPLDVDRLRLRTLKGKSPQSVKLTLALLRRLSRFGANKRICDPIPFPVEMPKVDNLKTEDLTQDQLSALFTAIDESEYKLAGALMKMALYTGMRRGEMFKLRWADIDFEKGFIRIVNPKGGTSQSIPLNDGARELLETLKKKGKGQYVFPGRKGGQRQDIHRLTRDIADKAGIPKTFRPLHGLRHVYASMLASSGKVDLYTLQKLLTHKDPRMTQRYAHLRDEALKNASAVAADIVGQAIQKASEEVEDLKTAKK